MRSRFLGVVFLVLALSFGLGGSGCGMLGLGGGGDGELGLLEFDSPPPTPKVAEFVQLALSFDPEVLVEVQFLYEYQVRLETMERLVRDVISLLDHSNRSEIDLEWVIRVHETSKEVDAFFGQVTEVRVPDPLREDYDYLFFGLLESVQVMGYGTDRLLAAAVKVGPTGRTLQTMPPGEVDEFLVLMREADFYMKDAARRVDSQLDETGRAINSLRLR